jgi:hypothetical protein
MKKNVRAEHKVQKKAASDLLSESGKDSNNPFVLVWELESHLD